jgi:hypothetical protein
MVVDPFRRYVDDALAALVHGKEYSFTNLTREIAQQLGLAHEDGVWNKVLS